MNLNQISCPGIFYSGHQPRTSLSLLLSNKRQFLTNIFLSVYFEWNTWKTFNSFLRNPYVLCIVTFFYHKGI